MALGAGLFGSFRNLGVQYLGVLIVRILLFRVLRLMDKILHDLQDFVHQPYIRVPHFRKLPFGDPTSYCFKGSALYPKGPST